MDTIVLRPFSDADIPRLAAWLDKEYIKKWYHDPDEWLHEVQNRHDEFRFLNHFIVTYTGKPIGFCQYYACEDAKEEWYQGIPLAGSYSIDYLIGEEEFLGKGLGKSIIATLVEKIFSLSGAQRIVVQPEEENKASCNTLLSNGFYFDEANSLYQKDRA